MKESFETFFAIGKKQLSLRWNYFETQHNYECSSCFQFIGLNIILKQTIKNIPRTTGTSTLIFGYMNFGNSWRLIFSNILLDVRRHWIFCTHQNYRQGKIQQGIQVILLDKHYGFH